MGIAVIGTFRPDRLLERDVEDGQKVSSGPCEEDGGRDGSLAKGRAGDDFAALVEAGAAEEVAQGVCERFDEEVRGFYSPEELERECIGEFIERYNTKRPHWALIPAGGGDPLAPEDVYVRGLATAIPRWQGWAKKAKAGLDLLMTLEAAA